MNFRITKIFHLKTSSLAEQFAFVSLCFMQFLAANVHSRGIEAPRIAGTFIQYQNWMLKLDKEKWQLELESIKNTGMDTIVIQWIKSDQVRFYPIHSNIKDPTEMILSFADKNNIKVFLGLDFRNTWWTEWDDKSYLNSTVKRSLSFAKKQMQRYSKHPSFFGWYIPYELSDLDYDDEEIKNLRNFLSSLSSGLKSLSKKNYPVSLSVFFEGKLDPSFVQSNYSKILNRSGIDFLLIQDGVGAQNWDNQVAEKVTPYFKAYREAAKKNNIHAWSVVESFANIKDSSGKIASRSPAPIARLLEQIKVLAPPNSEKLLTFDFFHYMSPHRGAAQRLLHGQYMQSLDGSSQINN